MFSLRTMKNGNEGGSEEKGEEMKEIMKKGPWTQAEDFLLREYVMKYGEGNWNSVQKKTGLVRCGKSCRLRWANHLRPNLKKGAFSKEEELIITHLHAQLGNKWAQMAAQLPGRTDNEIKNFWNTRLKRRQRAGLPLYPRELIFESNTYPQIQTHNNFTQPLSTSSLSFSSFLSSSVHQQTEPNSSSHNNTFPQIKFLNSSPYKQFRDSHPHFNTHSYAFNESPRDYHGFEFDSNRLAPVQGSNPVVSPSQSSTPVSSHASGVCGLMSANSSLANNNECCEVAALSPQENGGLLEAVVVEAQSLSSNGKLKSEDSIAGGNVSLKRKGTGSDECDGAVLMENRGNIACKTQRVDLNISQNSSGKKLIAEETMEGISAMDDDLFSLLNNFPSEMPVPGWYRNGKTQSIGLETQRDASSGSTNQEFAWTLGTSWSDLPNIC